MSNPFLGHQPVEEAAGHTQQMVVAAVGPASTRADEVLDEHGVNLRECADSSFAHKAIEQTQRRRFGDVLASQGTLVKHVSLDVLAQHAGP